MAVTIKDVARVAGVSHTTVSRALRDHDAISAETRAKVKAVAASMGYVPNTSARELVTRRSKILGVVVTRIDDPFFGEIIKGIDHALSAVGYSLFLAVTDQNPQREREVIQLMSQRRVEGIIICSTSVSAAHQAVLERLDVASVTINNQAREQVGHAVAHNDVQGAIELTQHLLALGHRRLGFIGSAVAGKTSQDRFDGFAQALSAAGMALDDSLVVAAVDGQIESGTMAAHQLFAHAQPPSAIVCFNDLVAIGAMQAARERGIDVPTECSITGFDDVQLAAYSVPQLTTFAQPKFELGHEAATMMLALLATSDGFRNGDDSAETAPAPQLKILQGELIVRRSTAAPSTP